MDCDSTTVFLAEQAASPRFHQEAAVDRLLAVQVGDRNLRSLHVLLKPNLITARNGSLACTDARLIGVVAQWFKAQGTRVVVGDSPAFGSAHSVLTAIKALPILRQIEVPVVEFRRTAEVRLPSGQKAAMAQPALECDLLVNLPKVKAHSQMRVTLAVKNLFGCLSGWQKPWWHMHHGGNESRFVDLLVELLAVLPAGCTLVDGMVAMHRTGPIHGEPYALGCLSGGTNPVAVDTALLAVLGIDPHRSPVWCASRRAGLQGTALEMVSFPWAKPDDFRVQGFEVPETLTPVRFNPFRFVKGSMQRLLLRLSE
jgi:uncharacterized protein (DUF362 family)